MVAKTLWLLDKNLPADIGVAIKAASLDKVAGKTVASIVSALHRLVSEASPHIELQDAVLESINTGCDVREILREREIAVLEQIEVVQLEKRLYKEKCLTQQAEIR